MSERKSTLDRMLEDLQRQRDELKLHIHLAKAEARDEWEALEKWWRYLRPKPDARGRRRADRG